jgi:hypothetical protein
MRRRATKSAADARRRAAPTPHRGEGGAPIFGSAAASLDARGRFAPM